MKRIIYIVAVTMFALSVGASFGDYSFGAEETKKEPVRITVIKAFKPDLPGIEKAQLIQFEMDPGAEVKNFTLGSELCWAIEGVFTYKLGGELVERSKGAIWYGEAGTVIDVYNRGKDVAVLRCVQFIRAK